MNPEKPGARRKRIILYYFLGVVLPGIILGYMAFRGIRNDQAIREKASLKQLEVDSQTFFSEVDFDLGRFVDEQSSDSIISGIKTNDPSILVLFIKDSTDGIQLISHQLLYIPAELLIGEPAHLKPPLFLREGQRLEFAEKRYPDALSLYQEILNTSGSEGTKEALVASARIYNKLNQPEEAKALYDKIQKDYRGCLLNGQIPLAPMAGLEIMKINRALGEENEMRIHMQRSLELLLHPDCEYDEHQFHMFFESFKEILMEQDDRIDSLIRKLEVWKARTDYLIRFLGKPDLITSGGHYPYRSSKHVTFGIPVNSSELQAMYFTIESKDGMQMGLVMDFRDYMNSMWERILREIDPDSSMNAKIENYSGETVFSRVTTEELGYLSFPFPDNLPAWKLLLSENRPGFVTTLMKAGSGIYLLALILILLLMLMGFVFILYTLNVELRLNRLKSEFISNVSHELKSPLTSIRMMTEMLHHNRVENEERKAEYYAAMLEESQHLSHLIDNILDFSRMEEDRKKYEFMDLDPDKLIREFLRSIRELIRETGFKISYSSPDKANLIRADRNAILQILYNLVDNAIKFSGTSKRIDIQLFFKGHEMVLSVKDYGIGISTEEQEKIFERFYRSSEPKRAGIRGSGIGLTIVKKIVEDHGGSLTLDSMPGEGSTFTVRLPVAGN